LRASKTLGAVIAALTFLALGAQDATASTYGVHECTTEQGGVNDARIEGATTGYTANNSCGLPGGSYLQMGTSGAVAAGAGKAWAFQAPAGTRINRATGNFVMQGQADHGGHQSFFFYRGDGEAGDTYVTHQGAGSTGGSFDSQQFASGPLDRIGVGVSCNSGATCPSKPGIYSRIGGLGLQMEDTVAPDQPQISGPALSGWITGTKDISFTVADQGAGIYIGNTAVNGTVVDLDVY